MSSSPAEGKLCGPLHGVPVLVKDQAETAGLRTTFGSILFTEYVPAEDATVVAKLKGAGAVILAKTAMCDFAAGWFSSSSLTGHTKNPYAPDRESGGSSAGTAAGVAANFGLVGIGEDTGGSIRIPAAYNNLFGLRVTTGLISRAGFSPLVHFQDTPAPVARTVTDLATTLDSDRRLRPEGPVHGDCVRGPPDWWLRGSRSARHPADEVADRGAGNGVRRDKTTRTRSRSARWFGRRSLGSMSSACR